MSPLPHTLRLRLLAAVLALGGCACGDDDDDTTPPPPDAGPDAPAAEDAGGPDAGVDAAVDAGPEPLDLSRWCGDDDPATRREDAYLGEPVGQHLLGIFDGLPAGTLETMKFIPEHLLALTEIEIAFGRGGGAVRIHLVEAFGRSYPQGWMDGETLVDLVPPVDLVLEEADPGHWMSVPMEALLLPGQHYLVAVEHVDAAPAVAAEAVPEGESSWGLFFQPGSAEAYGIDGNYRIALVGQWVCPWSEPERWFGRVAGAPWEGTAYGKAAVTDLDGDGHDDIVADGSGVFTAFRGDGRGGFAAAGFDAFPDAAGGSLLLFGDVDDDGDVDGLLSYYVTANSDGDDYTVEEGDCNDADALVSPGGREIASNGLDDDCDGTVDDGTDDSDADGDGFSIAAGDCDDTRAVVSPAGTEVIDALDDDCDGAVDDGFGKRVLLNDGTGRFAAMPDDPVLLAAVEPTTAAAFGDADGDGALDVYMGNWLELYPNDAAVQSRYFEGAGGGAFVDAQERAGMVLPRAWSVYGVLWNDWNNDGLQDIYVGNYHLYDNLLWKNLGDGTFVDVALEVGVAHDDIPTVIPGYPGGHSYGGDFGDVDLDGDMDFYLCNLSHPRTQPWADPSMFNVNQGEPDYHFVNERALRGFVYDEGDINATFADFDNDMDLDIAIGSVYPHHFTRLYRNDGTGFFTDVTYEANVYAEHAQTVVWLDADEDGDLDLLTTSWPDVLLFENRVGQERGWVELDLRGTTTNRDAIGARVTLTAGGVTQLRDVPGGGGVWTNQGSRIVHFGLGDETQVDTLTVRWVGGATETFTGVDPNGRYQLVEGTGVAAPLP